MPTQGHPGKLRQVTVNRPGPTKEPTILLHQNENISSRHGDGLRPRSDRKLQSPMPCSFPPRRPVLDVASKDRLSICKSRLCHDAVPLRRCQESAPATSGAQSRSCLSICWTFPPPCSDRRDRVQSSPRQARHNPSWSSRDFAYAPTTDSWSAICRCTSISAE